MTRVFIKLKGENLSLSKKAVENRWMRRVHRKPLKRTQFLPTGISLVTQAKLYVFARASTVWMLSEWVRERGFEYVFHPTTTAHGKAPQKPLAFATAELEPRSSKASARVGERERVSAVEMGKLRCFCADQPSDTFSMDPLSLSRVHNAKFLLSHTTLEPSQDPFIINYNHPPSPLTPFTTKHFHVGKTWIPHCG